MLISQHSVAQVLAHAGVVQRTQVRAASCAFPHGGHTLYKIAIGVLFKIILVGVGVGGVVTKPSLVSSYYSVVVVGGVLPQSTSIAVCRVATKDDRHGNHWRFHCDK
jgi:hypothetical protein